VKHAEARVRQTSGVESTATYKEGLRAPLIVAGLVGIGVVAVGAAVAGQAVAAVVLGVGALGCGFAVRNFCYRVTVRTDGGLILHYLFGNRKTRSDAVSTIELDAGEEEFTVEFGGGRFEMVNTLSARSVVEALMRQNPDIALSGYTLP
jgi:hypothetical protein